MARGGKREGAGRKPGSQNTKTREIADKAAADGITPIEVMLDTMRGLYEDGDKVAACAIAKDAAPYVHPRLAAVEHGGKDGEPFTIELIRRVVVDPKTDN